VESLALLRPLALSLAIGLLVGLQRGWQTRSLPEGHRVAGFRTFGLLGLAGGIAALLPQLLGAILLLAAAATLLIGYLREATPAEHSATGAIAGLLTLALGAFAASGHQTEALAAAAVMVALLAMRHSLHSFIRGIDAEEMEAATRFAIIALVILPLMPNRAMGPLDAWNPRQLWLVVVLVLGLSFAGYVATKRLGPSRGLLITAAAGALVSSTAVTAGYARRLKQPSPAESALVAGIAIASAVMYARVFLLTAILARPALPSLAAAVIPAGLVALGLAALAVRRTPGHLHEGELKLGNPLDFRSALLLAAFVALLAVASRAAIAHFGDAGVGALLLLTGFADVDAAVITLAGLPPGALEPHRAGILLALPVAANMVLKAGLALAIAPNTRGLRAATPLLLSVAAAAAGIAAMS
jgi:uncharacterized membrane protein (DUF4010 family)